MVFFDADGRQTPKGDHFYVIGGRGRKDMNSIHLRLRPPTCTFMFKYLILQRSRAFSHGRHSDHPIRFIESPVEALYGVKMLLQVFFAFLDELLKVHQRSCVCFAVKRCSGERFLRNTVKKLYHLCQITVAFCSEERNIVSGGGKSG